MKGIHISSLVFLGSAAIALLSFHTRKDASDQSAIAQVNAKKDTERGSLLRKSWTKNAGMRRALEEVWLQVGDSIYGEGIFDHSGRKVSLSADGLTLAIASHFNSGENGSNSGSVRVYGFCELARRWLQIGDDIDGDAANDNSGYSLSLSGDGMTVAIGASQSDPNGVNSGSVRTYRWTEDTTTANWEQVGDTLEGEAALDYFGTSVCLSANGATLAIGALAHDANGVDSGSATVYSLIVEDNGTTAASWVQIGNVIKGREEYDHLGRSIYLSEDGTTLAVGASSNRYNGINAGSVRLYRLIEASWSQIGGDISASVDGDHVGPSISLSANGMVLAVGAFFNNDNADYAGTVRVYTYCPRARQWTQMGEDIMGETQFDYFGRSVSLSADGMTFAAGAFSSVDEAELVGSVRVYRYTEENVATADWQKVGNNIDGEGGFEYFGKAVSLSSDGTRVAVGAYKNDGADGGLRDSGNVRVFSLDEQI